jgi:hypothetical protein
MLNLPNGQKVLAGKYPFKLPNGLALTYGQISGLGGDFYGTTQPISDGTTPEDRAARFNNAWGTLAVDTSRQPKEGNQILAALQQEVVAINNAVAKGIDPSTIYAILPDQTALFEALTIDRPSNEPAYLGLAAINWDHFGDDARTAYTTGHTAALKVATSGTTLDNLLKAYAINAFADHFLQDLFSAGHLRTPRRALHSAINPSADLCCKVSTSGLLFDEVGRY